MNIIFLRTRDNQEKCSRIIQCAEQALETEKRLLIVAPNEEAARYLDQLLWRMPQEGFVPHVITHTPCQDFVAITTTYQNLNQASYLLHLSPQICPIGDKFEQIYELYDMSNPEKELAAQQKVKQYQSKGLAVAIH